MRRLSWHRDVLRRRAGAALSLLVLASAALAVAGSPPVQAAVPAGTPAGAPFSWGYNDDGELGNGTCCVSTTAAGQVSVLQSATSLAAGDESAYAVNFDGRVWAWGNNGSGQLGLATVGGTYAKPVRVPNLDGVVSIAAGNVSAYALRSDGTVWAWGWNVYGQLGDGTTQESAVPKPVSGLTGVTAVVGGGGGGSPGVGSGYALKSDGSVWAWGANAYGQLCLGTTQDALVPQQVTGLRGAKALGAAFGEVYALMGDGTVRSCGYNHEGQLGNGTTVPSSTPVQVADLTNVVQLASGPSGASMAVIKVDGSVWTWGFGGTGALGDGVQTPGHFSSTPVQVQGLSNIKAVSKASAAYALDGAGAVWAWGSNASGQLGDGTNTNKSLPAAVQSLGKMNSIAAGEYSGYALRGNARVVQESYGTYSTGWTRATCTCSSGGTTLYASTAGATGTFSFTGSRVQIVSATGPRRGEFALTIDGQLAANISTYSPTSTTATIVWTGSFPSTGTHTVELRVAGTVGHPRVDVDALLVR